MELLQIPFVMLIAALIYLPAVWFWRAFHAERIRRRGKIELMAGGASDAGGFYPTMLITPGFW